MNWHLTLQNFIFVLGLLDLITLSRYDSFSVSNNMKVAIITGGGKYHGSWSQIAVTLS